MDLKKSNAILKKINVLHESAMAFDGKISSMERDLLLQYLRDLYDTLLASNTNIAVTQNTISKEIIKKAPANTAALEYQPVAKTIEPSQIMQEVPAPKVEPTKPVETPKANHWPESSKKKDQLAALFNIDDGQEVRSKFSALPISDISKSMGINDKILTINELFGGDQNLFNSVVHELNGFRQFDEAKEFLISGVAKKQGWYEENKRNKAQIFVKLIKRRYI